MQTWGGGGGGLLTWGVEAEVQGGGGDTQRRTAIKNELHIYFLFSTFKLFMQPFCSK